MTSRELTRTDGRALDAHSAARLVEAFLQGRSPRTLAAYRKDLIDFAAFLGVKGGVDHAARALLAQSAGEANGLALAYRAHLLDRQLKPKTINRRLSALRSLVKLAQTLGMVAWTLHVAGVRSKAYRDTRGPGPNGYRALLDVAGRQRPYKAARDRALLRLLYDLALRRGEVVGLDLADVDLDGGTVAIVGKGSREKERRTLPMPTSNALRAWLDERGPEPGPLFVNVDRAGKGQGNDKRLTGAGLYALVQGLGNKAGIVARPHGLRHAAITEALELTGGNVRAVAKFSRHADLRTLGYYDDNRTDLGGEIAKLVAESVGPQAA